MKYGKYIKYTFVGACIFLVLYFLPQILHLLMPFILALVVAVPCHKLVEFLNSKLRINRGFSSVVIFIIIFSIVGGLMGLLLYYIITQFQSFVSVLPDTVENIKEIFGDIYNKYRGNMPSVITFIEGQISSYKPPTSQLTNSALGYAANFATSIPSALFFALIYLLAVFFFIKDYSKVMDFFRESLPERVVKNIRFIKNTAWRGFVGYVKSQLILSSITALLVAVTFWVLGIEYSVVWGIIVGLIDAIPILGSGIVLVPFAIIHFIMNKNLALAICVIVLQVVAFIVRQLLSPRIMSTQLGLHPIITLLAIYIGNELMGVMGMVVFPILALMLVSIYNSYRDAKKFGSVVQEKSEKE